MIDDTPKGTGDDGGIVSEEDAIGALTDILEDEPETDNAAENEAQADDEPEGDDEADEAEDDAEGEESEDSDDGESGEDEDGSEELKGGRFAPHSAKVRLPDGTTTTVDELMKGSMRQSDYSRKTEAVAREREEVQAQRERVNQTFQALDQQRQFVATVLEQLKPQPPENPQTAEEWVDYQQREHAWNQWVTYVGQNLQQSQQQLTAAQREEMQKNLEREQQRLFQHIPEMQDPAERQRISQELVNVAGNYGYAPQEVAAADDHRAIRVLNDIRRLREVEKKYEALIAKAPAAVEKAKQKPKVLRGSKRGTNAKNDAKRTRIERLRETGSARDAEAALMDLDL